MAKIFKTGDCIHLAACRHVTALAKKALGEKGEKFSRHCNKQCQFYQPDGDTMERLESAIEDLERLVSRLNGNPKREDTKSEEETPVWYSLEEYLENEWISVDDALPKIGDEVVVCINHPFGGSYKHEGKIKAISDKNRFFFVIDGFGNEEGWMEVCNIAKWMPLERFEFLEKCERECIDPRAF